MTIVDTIRDTTATQRRNAKNLAFKLGNDLIQNKDCIKYLGIMINKKLDFISNTNVIISKVNFAKSELRKIFQSKFINEFTKILVYKL